LLVIASVLVSLFTGVYFTGNFAADSLSLHDGEEERVNITDVRFGKHKTFFRVVFEFSGSVVPRVSTLDQPPAVSLYFPDVEYDLDTTEYKFFRRKVKIVAIRKISGGTSVKIYTDDPSFKYVWSLLSNPYRFYIDVSSRERFESAPPEDVVVAGSSASPETSECAMDTLAEARTMSPEVHEEAPNDSSTLFDDDLSRALAILTDNSMESSLSDSALYFAGLELLNRSWYDMAVYCFSCLIKSYPASAYRNRATLGIGQAYYHVGIYEKSSEIFRRILDSRLVREEELMTRYHLALSLLEEKRYEASLEELKTIEALSRKQVDTMGIYEYMGTCLYHMTEYEEAIELLREGIRRTDDLEVILREWFLTGCCYEAIEFWDEAVSAYGNVTELYSCLTSDSTLDALYRKALLKIADCYYMEKDYTAAQNHYTGYLARFPDDENRAWALYQVANCEMFQEKFQSARGTCLELLKSYPDSYWAELAKWEMNYLDWRESISK
jgi:TolA-binding protein